MRWLGAAPDYAIQADSAFDVTVELVTDDGERVTDGVGHDAVLQMLIISSLDSSPTSRLPVEAVAEEGVVVFEGVSLQSAGLGLLFISVSHLSRADASVFGSNILPLEQLVRVAPLPPVINMTELRCPWLVAGSYTRCHLILRDRNENEVPALPCSTEYGGEAVCIDSNLRGLNGETSPVHAPPRARPALAGPAHAHTHTVSETRACHRLLTAAAADALAVARSQQLRPWLGASGRVPAGSATGDSPHSRPAAAASTASSSDARVCVCLHVRAQAPTPPIAIATNITMRYCPRRGAGCTSTSDMVTKQLRLINGTDELQVAINVTVAGQVEVMIGLDEQWDANPPASPAAVGAPSDGASSASNWHEDAHSVTQFFTIHASEIDPEETQFSCDPQPRVIAGSLLTCTIVTRGVFGNNAAGATPDDFAVEHSLLLGRPVHVDGAPIISTTSQTFQVLYYPTTSGTTTATIFFTHGDQQVTRSDTVTVVAARADESRLRVSCQDAAIEAEDGSTRCVITAQDIFGNPAYLSPPQLWVRVSGSAEPEVTPLFIVQNATLYRDGDGDHNASASSLATTLRTARVGTATLEIGFRNHTRSVSTAVTAVPSMDTLLPLSPYATAEYGEAYSAYDVLVALGGFSLVALGASIVATRLNRTLRFPMITGYLIVGVLAGPYLFKLVPLSSLAPLELVDYMALGFIGISAGAKLNVSEVRSTAGAVLSITGFLVANTAFLVTFTVFLFSLTGAIGYQRGMPDGERLGIAFLQSTISVARSPASAIALISELHARGPFTTVMLAVTVVMDVVVIVLFTVAMLAVSQVMHALEAEGKEADSTDLAAIIGFFVLQLVLSFAGGALLAWGLSLLLRGAPRLTPAHSHGADDDEAAARRRSRVGPTDGGAAEQRITSTRTKFVSWAYVLLHLAERLKLSDAKKRRIHRNALLQSVRFGRLRRMHILVFQLLVLGIGWSIFRLETVTTKAFGVTLIQPLIICMVAGFGVCNFSTSRNTLLALLEGCSAPVYVAFFTYSGCTLDVTKMASSLPLALGISLARLLGIVGGSTLGIRCSGMPRVWTRYAWMAFLTQAGVALGLAAQVSATFSWGDDFYSTVIACVVLNQFVGPPLFKYAILAVGEAHTAAEVQGLNPLTSARGVLVLTEAAHEKLAAELAELCSESHFEVMSADAQRIELPRRQMSWRRRSSLGLGTEPGPANGAALPAVATELQPTTALPNDGLATEAARKAQQALHGGGGGDGGGGGGGGVGSSGHVGKGSSSQRVQLCGGPDDSGNSSSPGTPIPQCGAPRLGGASDRLSGTPPGAGGGGGGGEAAEGEASMLVDPKRLAMLFDEMEDCQFVIVLLDDDRSALRVCQAMQQLRRTRRRAPTPVVLLEDTSRLVHRFQQLRPQPVFVIPSMLPLLPELVSQLNTPTSEWTQTLVNMVAASELARSKPPTPLAAVERLKAEPGSPPPRDGSKQASPPSLPPTPGAPHLPPPLSPTTSTVGGAPGGDERRPSGGGPMPAQHERPELPTDLKPSSRSNSGTCEALAQQFPPALELADLTATLGPMAHDERALSSGATPLLGPDVGSRTGAAVPRRPSGEWRPSGGGGGGGERKLRGGGECAGTEHLS